jgi:hypothetical protein
MAAEFIFKLLLGWETNLIVPVKFYFGSAWGLKVPVYCKR